MSSRLKSEVDILHRRTTILGTVRDHEPVGIVTLANRTNYAPGKVRYTVQKLESSGHVTRTAEGVRLQNPRPRFESARELRDALTALEPETA